LKRRDYYYIVILTEFIRCSDMLLYTAWTDLSEELFLKEDTLLTQIRLKSFLLNSFFIFFLISFINLQGLMNTICWCHDFSILYPVCRWLVNCVLPTLHEELHNPLVFSTSSIHNTAPFADSNDATYSLRLQQGLNLLKCAANMLLGKINF
jgi:hypothetical protein